MGGHECDVTTLVIGLDGACHTVLDRLDDGAIPTLRSLLSTGASGPLVSQIPPWTPSAWPSLYTGMNPGKHGVFDFLAFDGYDWDVVNATHLRERPLWEILDRHGYRSVVVNAPVTHPPKAFDGTLLPGYMAPESPTCHPDGLFETIQDVLGEYRIYPDTSDGPDGYVDAVTSRGAAFRYLVGRFDPDFGFLQFQQTDTVFHDRPDDWETIDRIFRAVDTEIERTLDACEPDTVFVVSDHGIGPLGGVEFRVNDFLADQGFVRTVNGGDGMPNWSRVRDGALKTGRDESSLAARPSLASGVGSLAARAGITTQRVGTVLDRLGLADSIARVVPSSLVQAGSEQVDFPSSRAYMRSRTECGIRLNLEGREPDGTVAPEQYDAVRARLIEALQAVETPAGDPLFEAVLPREAVFDGPETDRAADVLVVPQAFDHFLSATIRGETFGEPTEPWNHKRDGIFVAHGAAVDASRPLGDPTLFDVAPTVLATLGVPADERMDGRCLPIVDSPGRDQYSRPDRDERIDTDDQAVQRRLTDLGYIE
ncbi:MAG: alkaline phosphatase family protein [Halapricum sp.]